MHCHFTDIITGNQVPKVTQLEEEPEMHSTQLSLELSPKLAPPPQMNETQD